MTATKLSRERHAELLKAWHVGYLDGELAKKFEMDIESIQLWRLQNYLRANAIRVMHCRAQHEKALIGFMDDLEEAVMESEMGDEE